MRVHATFVHPERIHFFDICLSIGLDIARRLGLDGCKVVISSRKEANVDRAKAQLKSEGIDVIGVPCNVGSDEDRRRLVDATLEAFGGIDLLINNAAANPFFGHMLDVSTYLRIHQRPFIR